MIIPLTPIEEAWGNSLKIETPSSRPAVHSYQQVTGYVEDDPNHLYKIPTHFVPNTLDVTLKNKDVISQLLPLTSNKRTDLITNLIIKFFNPFTDSSSSSTVVNESSDHKKTEYYKVDDNQTVDMIIVILLLYILIDKFMTVWSRS
tara:strand:+ start:27634 stop:28071 length:438 start_codon:yes stop_codon:yes gene_type:complete